MYIHAKAIGADAGRPGQQVLVGSQNFSVASLGYNRELGVITTDPAVVAALGAGRWPLTTLRHALLPSASLVLAVPG